VSFRDLIVCGILLAGGLALVAWLYLPGISGPAMMDDHARILVIDDLAENPGLAWDYIFGDGSGPLGRPVAIASFVLEQIWLGDDFAVSKTINILLHLLNTVLLIWLFALLFRHINLPGYLYLSAALGLAWALSPLYVSTVLYVVQRMAILSTGFMLCAMIAYIYARQLFHRRFTAAALLLSAFAFLLLAVFSKENAVVLVPVILLMEVLWFQFKDDDGRTLVGLRSFTLVSILLGTVLAIIALTLAFDWLQAGFNSRPYSMGERLLTESRILWDYVGQLFSPDVLRMGIIHDDVTISRSLFEPRSTLLSVLGWSLVIALSLLLLKSYWGRLFVFGISWYLVGHSVESTVVPLELYFEHRNYFTGMGLFLAVGVVVAYPVSRWQEIMAPITVFLACYALWLGFHTSSQVQVWSNRPLLVLNNVNSHALSYRANVDMALLMADMGEVEAAQRYSRIAFENGSGEHRGDLGIRNLVIACAAGEAVDPSAIESFGSGNESRPFSSNKMLFLLVQLLENDTCPDFNWVAFSDRMAELFLHDHAGKEASPQVYLTLAIMENALGGYGNAYKYTDIFLALRPDDPQALLMKLHFATALEKSSETYRLRHKLRQIASQGGLTTAQEEMLSFYGDS
jgi:hypothetical protein